MPFADIQIPSLALTQLQYVTTSFYADKVQSKILYFNQEFADFLGVPYYEFISISGPSNNTGFGDWFFRQQAFPELEDNTKEYFDRYASHFGIDYLQLYHEKLKEKRDQSGQFLDKLIEENALQTYDIIGFTSMFMQNAASFALARKIKTKNPNIKILIGGANCESPMGEEIIKNVNCIDYVFSGTALNSFKSFLDNYIKKDFEQLSSINGIFTKENCLNINSKIDSIKKLGDELDINENIELDYGSFLLDYNKKQKLFKKKPYLLFETSRGCWWGAKAHCTFCGLNGGTMFYRAKSTSSAIDLFNNLFSKYATIVDHFACVDNIIPKEYINDVFPKLTVPEKVTMFYEVRADLQPEEMEILSQAHILEIQPGIESLATTTLKLMKKGTSAFNNIKFLKNTLGAGIKPVWNLLIGFPGEKEEVFLKYLKDIPLFYHLPSPSGVFPVRFDRYSPYFTKSIEYNLSLKPLDFYELTYPFNNQSLNHFAYYFGDTNYNSEYSMKASYYLKDLTKVVKRWVDRWKVRDNLLPPKLYFKESDVNKVIYDSRNGVESEFSLSDLQFDILNNINVYKNKAALLKEFDHHPVELIENSLSDLLNNGFVFEENGSFLNLVLDREPDLKNYKKAFH